MLAPLTVSLGRVEQFDQLPSAHGWIRLDDRRYFVALVAEFRAAVKFKEHVPVRVSRRPGASRRPLTYGWEVAGERSR